MRGVSVGGFSFWPWGTGIVMPVYMEPMDECLVSLAGPVFHLLLLPFLFHFPRLFTVNLAMLAVNALPLLPLDGGRILKSLLLYVFPVSKAYQICDYLTKGMAITVSLFLFLLFIQTKRVIPLMVLPFFVFLSVHRVKRESAFGLMRRFSGCLNSPSMGDWYFVSSGAKAILIYTTLYRKKENLYFVENSEKICAVADEREILSLLGREGSGICFRKILRNIVEKNTQIR